ncbi:hypothetical protein HPB50_011496 [Hyalomma asiaticum]|uniref:Uncharacterized protein n=1 Tax=Hyalomma asiaticum TaxID=266040 RepID=A0ACB7RSG7_HYAAI|nr:hypothetical protein HPB50_011496 [Hyalomma asiaticum]
MPPRKTAQAHDEPEGLAVAPPIDTHSSTSFLGATGESEASASSQRSGSLSASTPASSIIPFTEGPTGAESGSVFPATGVTVEVRPDQEEATRRELQERNRVLALAWIWGMLPGVLAGAALTYSLWSVGTPITKSTEGSPNSPDTTTLTESHTTVLSASPTAPAPTTPATPATPPPTAPTLPTPPTTAPPAPVTEPPSPTTLLPPSATVPTVSTMVPTVSETAPTAPTTTTTVPTTTKTVTTTMKTVTTTRTTTRTTTTKPTVPATQTTVPRETFYPGGPRLATEYLNVSLNWTIKPCEDFFGYVCGTFKGPYTSVLSNVGVYIKEATKAMLFTVDVPPKNQTPTEKAAGLFKACVQLAYNGTGSEAAALRSFLRPVGLDVSNMAPDPNFVVWETMMRLSMEFGFPTLVEFGAVRRASRRKKLLTMEILKTDEEWIKTSHMDHSAPGALANHYEKYLKLYDPKLNFTSLTSRIIAAEKSYGDFLGVLRTSDTVSGIVVSITFLGRYTAPLITGADWLRVYEQLTNNTFRATDSVVLWDNATAVVVFASDNARLAREDARLLMAWNTLRRLVVYTSRVAMKRLQKEDVEDFCLKTVSGVLEVAVTSRYVSTCA